MLARCGDSAYVCSCEREQTSTIYGQCQHDWPHSQPHIFTARRGTAFSALATWSSSWIHPIIVCAGRICTYLLRNVQSRRCFNVGMPYLVHGLNSGTEQRRRPDRITRTTEGGMRSPTALSAGCLEDKLKTGSVTLEGKIGIFSGPCSNLGAPTLPHVNPASLM